MKNPELQKALPLPIIAKSLKVLFRIVWQADKRTLILYFLTAVIGGLIALGTSWVLKLLIDELQEGQAAAPTTVPMIIVFVLVARYLMTLVQDLVYQTYHHFYLDYLLRYQLQNAVTKRFVEKVSNLDIAYFENPKTQDLISGVRLTMKSQLADLMRLLGAAVRDVISYLAAFLILLPFGWPFPFVITLCTIPRMYLRSKYGALQWSIWGAGAPQTRKLWYYDNLFANPAAVREMKIARSAPALIERFNRIQDELLALNKQALLKYIHVSILPPILETVVIVAIAYFFLDEVLTGALSIGSYTLLVNMLGQINVAAANVASDLGRGYEKGLYLSNYVELLQIPPLVPTPEQPVPIDPSAAPKIEFRNVSFTYPDGPSVLHDISFTIEPGENVALVGDNGAGKSTIINLLCRFYDVTQGEILINGVNIKQIDLCSWYAALGTLFQQYVQYHFTVRENIASEDAGHAPLAELEAAAQKSGAHDFIKKMPGAYDQQLGRAFEGGEELSGGQWQKLAIARAFYSQPPVLILDEPTSSIDAEAEYRIFNNLEAEYRDKSLILVSHRFSTVRNADKIYVIDNGRIIEEGTHEGLLKKEGKYAAMFRVQARGYN
jgi:ATP-binding cassette subfamily B protein